MKILRWIYPSIVGMLLGLLQTGLYFQLSFTLSSSFKTFLMVTVCWLIGSVIGTQIAPQPRLKLGHFIVLALTAYFACAILLRVAPFNTQLWPVYAFLVVLTGLYPGVFFVRFAEHYSARKLFFKENNGFTLGLISGTIFFLLFGRIVLWMLPTLIAVLVMLCTTRLLSQKNSLFHRGEMMKTVSAILLMLLCLNLGQRVSAQDSVTVPDLTGLNVPQAAAELNRVGLRLGTQEAIAWNADSGLSENTISGQSIDPGTETSPGTTIDVTVLRSPNVALQYKDTSLTVINLGSTTISLTNLAFATKVGEPTSFAGSRWSPWAVTLEPGECAQVWTILRNGPEAVDGCVSSTYWLTTNNPQEHFWTQANGVEQFNIVENGIERAVCSATPTDTGDLPLRCEAYIPGVGESTDTTSYIYFVYTTQAFAVIDKSPDKWMPTAQTTIFNYNPSISVSGAPVPIGDPTLYGSPETVANIGQLAPNQCLLFTNDDPNAISPESCDVVAQLNIGTNLAFWLADFQVDTATDDVRRQCPAAVPGKITICVLPL